MLASVITTVSVEAGADISFFKPFKELSKFFIVMAMAAIGFHTDIVKLVKTGGEAYFNGPVLLDCHCGGQPGNADPFRNLVKTKFPLDRLVNECYSTYRTREEFCPVG